MSPIPVTPVTSGEKRVIGWIRRSPSCWVNPLGYQISVSVLRGVHSYSAWTPDAGHDEHSRRLLWKYTHGTRVPQRRELLGVYFNLEAARAACDQHQEVPHGASDDPQRNAGTDDLFGRDAQARAAKG